MQATVLRTALLLLWISCAVAARISDAVKPLQEDASEDRDSALTPLKPYHVVHECINTTSVEGVFYMESNGREETCGLYLFSPADTVLDVQLEYVNVLCHTGGLIALIDGWEMNGQLFPSPDDHQQPLAERHMQYCGSAPPPYRLHSSQNVALLQYRLPEPGSAVSIRVRHVPNPAPCNQLMEGSQVFTLRNAGQRKNCSLLSMNPVEAQVLPFLVGVSASSILRRSSTDQPHQQCDTRGWSDFVEVGETTGLDTGHSHIVSRLCGRSLTPGPAHSTCSGMFVTRLVSSGLYDNVVSVRARLLTTAEMMSRCFAQYDLPEDLSEALADYDW